MDEQRIEGPPLDGRNAAQLMRLTTGVTNDPNVTVASGTTYPGTNPVSINGNRSNTTNYLLDGTRNNDLYSNAPNFQPNPDALQEFSVHTEFGRQSGGIVNAVTKSGTNELHGTAFEYVRNNGLNANFFSVVNGSKLIEGLKRNQFGATISGPVWIAKRYHGRGRRGVSRSMRACAGSPSSRSAITTTRSRYGGRGSKASATSMRLACAVCGRSVGRRGRAYHGLTTMLRRGWIFAWYVGLQPREEISITPSAATPNEGLPLRPPRVPKLPSRVLRQHFHNLVLKPLAGLIGKRKIVRISANP